MVGMRALRRTCLTRIPPFAQSLGAGHLDVVGGQDLQHRGAQGLHEYRREEQRDGQGRQGQVHHVAEKALAVPGDGQEAEPQAEQQHQQQAHPERRHGEADHAADADGVIDRPIPVAGREQRQRQRQHHGDEGAVRQQEDGDLEPLADDGGDRRLLDDRGAQVTVQGVPDEPHVLHREGLVEAQLGVGRGHHLVRRPAVQHDADGVARHELNGEERDQRHAEHDEHHLAQPAEDVGDDRHRPALNDDARPPPRRRPESSGNERASPTCRARPGSTTTSRWSGSSSS